MERGQGYQTASLNGNGKLPKALPLSYQPEVQETDSDDLNLRQILTMVRRRALIIAGVALSVTSAIAIATLRQTPLYESRFQLLVEPVASENKLSQLTAALNGNAAQNSGLDYETQIQVLRSPKLMAGIVKQIDARCQGGSYEEIVTKMGIARLGETKILQVSYRDTDPQKIECVLKEIAQGYINYSQQEPQISVNQGIRFVDGQLPQSRQRVDKLQAQLQVFRQQHNLLDPESQAQEMYARLGGLEQQRLESLGTLNETQTLYDTLQKQLGLAPDQAIAVSALSDAPRYQQFLNQLQQVETQIATESARFTEDSPTIQALRDQQQNLLPLLRKEAATVLGNTLPVPGSQATSPNSIRSSLTSQLVDVANQIKVLEVHAAGIAQAQANLNQQVSQMPLLARQYTDLQRELAVATESLNRFLGVRESLQIEAAQKELPWQMLFEPQAPLIPVSPNIPRNIILGAVAGLLLGMGVALLLERLDNVFHTLDELKEKTKLPLLGVIPFNKQMRQMKEAAEIAISTPSEEPQPKTSKSQPRWYNASPFLEAYRSLHTNISFLGSDTPIRSLVVSSATPGDGKSTTSTHLAQAAAAMGQRVLLVDADMRRPQVHHVLGLPKDVGLSNILATDINPTDAMHRLPMWDNLWVITAGHPLPPDPARLLNSKKMLDMMEQFHAEFDLVIYDTPPVLGLSDGRLLAAYTAGIVLVVALGKTDRTAVIDTLDLLKISSTPVLGVVANGIKSSTMGSYYYYQSYYTQESEVEKAKNILQKGLGNSN